MSVYVCIACAAFVDGPGSCATCGEVLLDSRREDVRELCTDIDDRRRRARGPLFPSTPASDA